MSGGDPSHDPEERHDTPLALRIKALIRERGPITVHDYMQLCLSDPEHGYYRRKPAIGAEGDFITAPEISQCFGEIIGLWAVVAWQRMGRPKPFSLIELGPGRGTMMRDMLRAARAVPGFAEAVRVVLIETSEALAAVQRRTLAAVGIDVMWPTELPAASGPTILVANEYLDTLPAQQWQRSAGAWHWRTVDLDANGRLCFSVTVSPGRPTGIVPLHPADGDIFERTDAAPQIHCLIGGHFKHVPAIMLMLDYGHAVPSFGETLQAVRGHRHVHPLAYPGESDLTVQVDFGQFGRLASNDHATGRPAPSPVACDGPITQAEFLGRLGIVERASRLMAANPAKALAIEAGVKRLLDPAGMGGRFKVIAVRSPMLPIAPGFEALDRPGPRG